MPWILYGPFLPPESTAEAGGSTATLRKEGLRDLITGISEMIKSSAPPMPTCQRRSKTSYCVEWAPRG